MSVQGLFVALAWVATISGGSDFGPAPPTGPQAAPPPALIAKAGSIVELELDETVSTKTVKRGDRFALKLARPVIVDSQVVIPAEVVGFGQVVDAGRPGLGGKPAKLVLAARQLDIGDQHVALRSFFVGATGTDSTGAALAVSFIPYAGLASIFIQGGQVVIPKGTRARAKLAQDFSRAAPAAAQAPISPVQ